MVMPWSCTKKRSVIQRNLCAALFLCVLCGMIPQKMEITKIILLCKKQNL